MLFSAVLSANVFFFQASINILEFPQNALNQQQRDVLLAYIDHFIPSEEPTREGLVEYGAALFETLTPEVNSVLQRSSQR